MPIIPPLPSLSSSSLLLLVLVLFLLLLRLAYEELCPSHAEIEAFAVIVSFLLFPPLHTRCYSSSLSLFRILFGWWWCFVFVLLRACAVACALSAFAGAIVIDSMSTDRRGIDRSGLTVPVV